MKKLSSKERNELVTKGYLEDVLEQKLNKMFDDKFNEKFALWSMEMKQHVAALIEDSNDKFRLMTDGYFDHDKRIIRLEEFARLR